MSQNLRSLPTLARLEPEGKKASVAERLESLRSDVSGALEQHRKEGGPFVVVDPEQKLAWWGNGGWRNGGWRNGGWGNWHNW